MARDGIDLLPDGADNTFEEGDGTEIDLSNLTIDFSSQEAASEARIWETLPTGAYHVKVTDVAIKQATSEKNRGKPYYALTLTVQDGKYIGKKLWSNVMLWSGAGYTLAQIMKAMNRPVGAGVKVPLPQELLGYDFIVIVQKMVDKYKIEQGDWDGEGPKPTKAEVKGFKKWDGDVAEKIPGNAGLLP
jgi:hypothetical protein